MDEYEHQTIFYLVLKKVETKIKCKYFWESILFEGDCGLSL